MMKFMHKLPMPVSRFSIVDELDLLAVDELDVVILVDMFDVGVVDKLNVLIIDELDVVIVDELDIELFHQDLLIVVFVDEESDVVVANHEV
jgi:hypothetical protein